jgi:predicted nucleic acid-binding protein
LVTIHDQSASRQTDRIIIATARHLAVPVVTADRKIIDYTGAGHVRVIPAERCRNLAPNPSRV